MSERRAINVLDLLIITTMLTTVLFVIAFQVRSELRDLQRRVGQLEQVRR